MQEQQRLALAGGQTAKYPFAAGSGDVLEVELEDASLLAYDGPYQAAQRLSSSELDSPEGRRKTTRAVVAIINASDQPSRYEVVDFVLGTCGWDFDAYVAHLAPALHAVLLEQTLPSHEKERLLLLLLRHGAKADSVHAGMDVADAFLHHMSAPGAPARTLLDFLNSVPNHGGYVDAEQGPLGH